MHRVTKPIPCQRGTMYLIMCWPNLSHANDDTKSISTDKTLSLSWAQNISQHVLTKINPVPARTLNVSQNVLTNPPNVSQHCCQTPPIAARTQNASQLLLTKPLKCQKKSQKVYQNMLTKPCQRGQKMYFNMCRQNTSHASRDTKCISTCVL